MAERQAQLPRSGVERPRNAVLQRGRRNKSNAMRLGVSCSVLLGLSPRVNFRKSAIATGRFSKSIINTLSENQTERRRSSERLKSYKTDQTSQGRGCSAMRME